MALVRLIVLQVRDMNFDSSKSELRDAVKLMIRCDWDDERVFPREKLQKKRAEPITKMVKLVYGNCAGKLFNEGALHDCVPTDDLEQLDFTSKAHAIGDSGSTMNGCVVTLVYENSTEKLVLDNSSQTVYSKIRVI